MNSGEIQRRSLWLAALQHGTGGAVLIVEGYYKQDKQKGRVEKRTDTNIAIGMVRDALVPPRTTTEFRKGHDTPSSCDFANPRAVFTRLVRTATSAARTRMTIKAPCAFSLRC
jgi:hypothetical protein